MRIYYHITDTLFFLDKIDDILYTFFGQRRNDFCAPKLQLKKKNGKSIGKTNPCNHNSRTWSTQKADRERAEKTVASDPKTNALHGKNPSPPVRANTDTQLCLKRLEGRPFATTVRSEFQFQSPSADSSRARAFIYSPPLSLFPSQYLLEVCHYRLLDFLLLHLPHPFHSLPYQK